MRLPIAVALALLTTPAMLALPAAAAAPQPAAAPVVVHIANFTFGPPLLRVRVGQTVIWVNDDDIPHNVVANDHAFKSKVLDTGERFSYTFTKAGTVPYFCSLHPHMTAQVQVVG